MNRRILSAVTALIMLLTAVPAFQEEAGGSPVDLDALLQEIELAPAEAETRFTEVLVNLPENTVLYNDGTLRQELGRIEKDSVVYVLEREITPDYRQDVLTVAIAVEGVLLPAFLRAEDLMPLSEAEAAEYAVLAKDGAEVEQTGVRLLNAEIELAGLPEQDPEVPVLPVTPEMVDELSEQLEELTPLSEEDLRQEEIEVEMAALTVGNPVAAVSANGKSVVVKRPSISGGTSPYTVYYGLYLASGTVQAGFYSDAATVAITPGVNNVYTVKVTVTDAANVKKTVSGGEFVIGSLSSTPSDAVAIALGSNGKTVTVTRPSAAVTGTASYTYYLFRDDGTQVDYTASNAATVTLTAPSNGHYGVSVGITDSTGTRYVYSDWYYVAAYSGVTVPAISKLTVIDRQTVHVDFKNVIGAQKYELLSSTDGSTFSKVCVIPNGITTAVDDNKPKVGVTIYYKIRAFGLDGSEIGTSAAKTVTVPSTLAENIKISVQPKQQVAAVGEQITLTFTASGMKSIQWQYSDDKGLTWVNSGASGKTTKTITFKMKAAYNGRLYRAKLTNSAGESTHTWGVYVSLPAEITQQPESVEVAVGQKASFSVAATGAAGYQWQYCADGSSWKNFAGETASSMTIVATEKNTTYQIRCRVTRGNGAYVYSSAVKLRSKLLILRQPVSKAADPGASMSFEVTASGVAAYQWQYSNDGETWTSSSNETAKTGKFVFAMADKYHGHTYRCKITGTNGTTKYTSAVSAWVKPRITTQPTNQKVTVGDTVNLKVVAKGAKIYRWQYTTDGTTWKQCGSSNYWEAAYSFKMADSLNGRKYRCKITGYDDTVIYSNAVTLTRKDVLVTGVTLSKTSLTMIVGTPQTITATVKPDNATNKTVTWTSSNASVATVSGGKITPKAAGTATITATAADGSGKKATCAVTVHDQLSIVTQPANQSVFLGDTMTVSVVAKGAKTYRWQVSTDGGSTWSQCGAGNYWEASYSLKMTSGMNGRKYRCKLTGYDGATLFSSAATVTVANVAVTSVTLSKTSLTMVVGTPQTITATVKPDNATNKTINWSSSNTSVATVSGGKITPKAAGTATITATAADGSGKKATCAVTVHDQLSIVSHPSSQSVLLGDTMTVSVVAKGAKTYRWQVSTDGGSSWSQCGAGNYWEATYSLKMTAGMDGRKYRCKLTGYDGTVLYSSAATVTLKTIPVTSITLNTTSVTLKVGGTATLTATVLPSNATNKNVNWKSSTPSVATVSGGKVTAVSTGTATITAEAADGSGKKAYCTVIVIPNTVAVTSITLSSTSLSLKVGGTATLTATVLPTNATNRNVNWSTSNSSVATVSGGTVTAKGVGSATITATAADGSGKKATCTVTVTANTVAVTSITLSSTSLSLKVGGTATLTATVLPTNATNRNVNWSTSNTSVATVSGGTVTARGVGSATITATAADGSGKKATCSVTVTSNTVAITSISLSASSLSIAPGKTATLTATIAPSNQTVGVTWSSTDTSVASVSGSGSSATITARSAGQAWIGCWAADGSGVGASCLVTVASSASYRGLVIVETAVPGARATPELLWDMDNVAAAVRKLNGGYTVTTKRDLTKAQVRSAISTAYSGASSGDMSFFFIGTHGIDQDLDSSLDSLEGAMCVADTSNTIDSYIKLSELASWLSSANPNNEVVVVLSYCGSGAAVKGTESNQKRILAARKAVSVFARMDPGVTVTEDEYDENGVFVKRREFQRNKFYVLTASNLYESSVANPDVTASLMGEALVKALTISSGYMGADSNKDKKTTFNELYSYVYNYCYSYRWREEDGSIWRQEVQRYPTSSEFVVFWN